MFIGLDTGNICNQNQPTFIEASKPEFYLANTQLTKCVSINQQSIIIQAKEGQVMNVSRILLQNSAGSNNIIATIEDIHNGNKAFIGDGPRKKQLIVSTSHEIELTLTDRETTDNHFMLHIKGNNALPLTSVIVYACY